MENLQRFENQLENLKPSHQEATRIKEGWQMGMYEKQITNYEGTGPIIRVYAGTSADAEFLAAYVCAKIKNSVPLAKDVYGDLIPKPDK